MALVAVLAVSCQQPAAPTPSATSQVTAAAPTPDLTHNQYRAIVSQALHAARQYADTSGTGVIPPQFWGSAISSLHPLRVEEEVQPNINVYIVLSEDSASEHGLCVCQIDSAGNTSAPAVPGLETLCADPDQDGVLYRYWRNK